MTKLDGFLFVLGFVIFVIGYKYFRPITIDSVLSATTVTAFIAIFFYAFDFILMRYQKMRFFYLFVITVFVLKQMQMYFDPDATTRYEWLEYAYFVIAIGILVTYWIKSKFIK